MPKMSVCRCAAVMCGAKAHESARFYSNSNPVAYSTGEFGEVQQIPAHPMTMLSARIRRGADVSMPCVRQ